MSDVVLDLPFDIVKDENSLIAYWVEYASLPMMDDGVVYWYRESGPKRFIRQTYKRLEKDTNLKFRRTRDYDKAEINHFMVDEYEGNPYQTGEASWTSDERVWQLSAKRWKYKKGTIVHEIGHALGLTHPENHGAETDTIMSYYRDRSIKYFTPKDIDYLTGIYI